MLKDTIINAKKQYDLLKPVSTKARYFQNGIDVTHLIMDEKPLPSPLKFHEVVVRGV